MTNKILSKRYAKALINLLSRDEIDKIRQDLQIVLQILRTNQKLISILKHPLIRSDDKKRSFNMAFRGRIEEKLLDFIEALISKRRIDILPDVINVYNNLADEVLGIIRAKVKATFALDTTQQENIKEQLASLTRGTIVLDVKIEPELLGGVAVQIGDRVFDATVKARLRDLKEKLLEKV